MQRRAALNHCSQLCAFGSPHIPLRDYLGSQKCWHNVAQRSFGFTNLQDQYERMTATLTLTLALTIGVINSYLLTQ